MLIGTPTMDVHPDKAWKSTLYVSVMLAVGRCARCQRSANACRCDGPVEQCVIAEDIGAQAYHPKNARMSYDDALSGAVTNGLMRCCSKTLGAFLNCWDPRWAEAARAAVGVKVRVVTWDNKEDAAWRRFDRLPLEGEQGIAPGSPNADLYGGAAAKAKAPTAAPAPASEDGERIGIIRRVDGGWVVQTDRGEHDTDSEFFVRDLEALKARGLRVRFEDEVVQGRRGQRRKIVEFTAVEKRG
jgi:hypothetical protein